MNKSIKLLAVTASLLSFSVKANDLAQIKVAEHYFNKIEREQGLIASTAAPNLGPDNLYYKDYGNDSYGVRLGKSDGNIYKKSLDGSWTLVAHDDGKTIGAQIIKIGNPSGFFGRVISSEASLVGYNLAFIGPVLVAKKYSRLTESEKKIIVSSYRSGYSVAMLYPTGGDITALRGDLGLPRVDMDSSNMELWGAYENKGEVNVLQVDESVPGVSNAKGFSDYALASSYLAWIRESEKTLLNGRYLHGNAITSEFPSLEQLSASQTNNFIYRVGTNIYSVRTDFWVAYSVPKNKYYIYAREKGILNSSNDYRNYSATPNPAGKYEINNLAFRHWVWNFPGYERGKNTVSVVDHLPLTTINQVQTSSGISWSIGGQVDSGGPSLSAGVEISSSTTYASNDVETIDQSGRNLNDTAWYFDIRIPENCGNCVPTVPNLAHSTFSPVMEWLWEVDGSLIKSNPAYKDGFTVIQHYNSALYDMIYETRDWEYRRWRTAVGPTTADKLDSTGTLESLFVIKMPSGSAK